MITSVAATCAILTNSTDGKYKFSIKITQNREEEVLSDVALRLTTPSKDSPMGSSHYATGACINTGSSNYTLTTTSTTLSGFGIEWQCSSACNSLDSLHHSVKFYAGANWGLDTSNKASASSDLTQYTSITGNNTNMTSYDTSVHTFYGLSASQLRNQVYFPNQTETWYMKCFAKFNHSSTLNLDNGISDLSTTLGNENTVTVKGKSHQVALFLYIVGVLTIFLA
ncbi:unnamed protein product [Moneuplotes crassus]|uniref:Uncharacterized protein n=2 Tax=Euplotes crassus TaxID=5936 RepID=A0AAD1XPP3_EUPCR|nr:unnamed protein product [Moneuplotes crassus]